MLKARFVMISSFARKTCLARNPPKKSLTFGTPLHLRQAIKEWLECHPNTWYYMTLAAGCILFVGGVVVACAGAIPIGIAMISSATAIIVHITPDYGQQLTMVPPNVATAEAHARVMIATNDDVLINVTENGRIDTFKVETRTVTYISKDGPIEDPGSSK